MKRLAAATFAVATALSMLFGWAMSVFVAPVLPVTSVTLAGAVGVVLGLTAVEFLRYMALRRAVKALEREAAELRAEVDELKKEDE